MNKLPARLARLSIWRRRALATGLGVLSVLALPPLHLILVLAPAFAGLMLLLGQAGSRKSAFGTGWWFGFGFFTAGLYWISNALLIDAARFAWLIPFSLFGLSAFLAVFIGLACLLSWQTSRSGLGAALALAACWTLSEWVRGFILTGFPWNLIASVWVPVPPMLQADAWLGPYGLGFLTVLASSSWYLWFMDVPHRRLKALLPAAALVLLALAGAVRLSDATGETVPDVRLRLVQPSIPQTLKWKTDLRFQHLLQLIELSRSGGGVPPTHVIWAETAVPYLLDNDVQARLAVAKAVPEGGLVITGAVRTTAPDIEPFQVWNSLEALDELGRIKGSYDKFHLVPFGEYMPLKSILPLKKITQGATDFSPGPGPRTIDLPGLPPVGPLICYEVIFPLEVSDPARRPGWLLNLTNDSWYGLSAGPYQHFAAARMRAVEEGLPLVRVANSGITGIIDPFGRVTAKLDLGETGIVDGELPKPLNIPTLYTKIGDKPLVLGLLLLVITLKFMLSHTKLSAIRYKGSG